jgi:hypothetical protein
MNWIVAFIISEIVGWSIRAVFLGKGEKEEGKEQQKAQDAPPHVETSQPEKIVCPQCGSEVKPGKNFCTTCGAKLK